MNRLCFQLLFVTTLCLLKVYGDATTVVPTGTPRCTETVPADAKQVTIQCPITEGKIEWTKDSEAITADDKKYTIEVTNRTLTIAKIDKAYSGEFKCSSDDAGTHTLTVCVLPHVEKYDKAKNVIEGDPFQTDCVAWGYPAVTVEWTHENNFTGAEHRTALKNGTTTNSILRIENMQYEDSGYYTCTVRNELGVANATLQVNVKDKLAALWPFLGICAEVAILCIIIFFYERRRAKILEKEAAQSEETEHINNDAKVSDDVRHRK